MILGGHFDLDRKKEERDLLRSQASELIGKTQKEGYIDLSQRLAEAAADPKQEIAGVNINSYASPEGKLDFNTALAEKREKNTTAFVENQLKKDKITEFGELTSSFTPEDWDGFRELVEKSNIQDKELPLRGVGTAILPRPQLRLGPAPLPRGDAPHARHVASHGGRGV